MQVIWCLQFCNMTKSGDNPPLQILGGDLSLPSSLRDLRPWQHCRACGSSLTRKTARNLLPSICTTTVHGLSEIFSQVGLGSEFSCRLIGVGVCSVRPTVLERAIPKGHAVCLSVRHSLVRHKRFKILKYISHYTIEQCFYFPYKKFRSPEFRVYSK